MRTVLLVGFGGFAGSTLRYLASRWAITDSFPLNTFLINIAGSFLIGALTAFFMAQADRNSSLALFFITGFCGGFTTFSALSFENIKLIEQGRMMTALIYSALSVIVGILACLSGYKLFQ